jgi:cell division protein FtsI/penicillin-binding protein 2
LPGEVPGIVHEVSQWSKVTIAQLPMGHGIAVNRMQMMMAMAAIANDGWLLRPMLVSRLEDREGQVMAHYTPQPVRQVISTNTARQMVRALKTVTAAGGTATQAALEHHVVAGKTGTAQKPGPGGYMPGKYIASFVGFFPADNPQLCIGVFFDEPHKGHYGGAVAAPVFQRIAAKAAAYLGLPPDDSGIVLDAPTGEEGPPGGIRTAYQMN